MDLKTYLDIAGKPRGQKLAAALGVHVMYVRHIALGHRRPGEVLALNIEQATNGQVTVADLRPDLAEALDKAGYVLHPELRHAA